MDSKKLELFNELKQLDSDFDSTFFEENSNITKSKLKQLIKFVKKGHSLSIFKKNKRCTDCLLPSIRYFRRYFRISNTNRYNLFQ